MYFNTMGVHNKYQTNICFVLYETHLQTRHNSFRSIQSFLGDSFLLGPGRSLQNGVDRFNWFVILTHKTSIFYGSFYNYLLFQLLLKNWDFQTHFSMQYRSFCKRTIYIFKVINTMQINKKQEICQCWLRYRNKPLVHLFDLRGLLVPDTNFISRPLFTVHILPPI